jgi:mRNA-degrading endonuclease RelE of RelBE toxin-antitoxin system
MYEVKPSTTFRKQYRKYDKKTQARIRARLEDLKEDPFTPRPKMDIIPLTGTKPLKHRLRVGSYRIIYCVYKEKNLVKLIETFPRGRDYRKL